MDRDTHPRCALRVMNVTVRALPDRPSLRAVRNECHRGDAARPTGRFDWKPSVSGHKSVCAMCFGGFFKSGLSLSLFAKRDFVPPPVNYLPPVLGCGVGAFGRRHARG